MGRVRRFAERLWEWAGHAHLAAWLLELFGWRGMLLSLVTGVAVAGWSYAKHLSPPEVASTGIASFASLLVCVSVGLRIRDRWRRKPDPERLPHVAGDRPQTTEHEHAFIRMSVGETGQFVKTKSDRLYSVRRTFCLKLENVSRSRSAQECKVSLLHIEPKEYEGPWVVDAGFTLAAGDYRYVPLARYREARDPKRFDCADSFIEILPPGPSQPKPSKDRQHVLTLRATAVGSAPTEIQCKVWVSEDGRFRIGELTVDGNGTDSAQKRVYLHDAAQRFYEAMERDGLDGMVATNAVSPSAKLDHFKYVFLTEAREGRIALHGVRPPSRQSVQIPRDLMSGLRPGGLNPSEDRNSYVSMFAAGSAVFHSVWMSEGDLARVIEGRRAMLKRLDGRVL